MSIKLNGNPRLLRAIDDEIIQMLAEDDVENEVVECEDSNGQKENLLALFLSSRFERLVGTFVESYLEIVIARFTSTCVKNPARQHS